MIQSMTAFSSVQYQSDSVAISWELRSLNHRYLDASFRLPESLRYLEPKLRQSLRGVFMRGKLDFQLKINELMVDASSGRINEIALQGLLDASKKIAATYHLPDDVMLSHVMAWPGVFEKKSESFDNCALEVERLFKEGLDQLIVGRRAEGMALEALIKSRLNDLRYEVSAAKENTHLILESAKMKLKKRLDALEMNVQDTRLEQELALTLTRLDVSEEFERLQAHMNEVERTLNADEPSGKRLDFLMQELNREANTLSSKSDSAQLTQHAVQMKVLIEQMREQIQNIE